MAKYTYARSNKFAIVLDCLIVYYNYRIIHLVRVSAPLMLSGRRRLMLIALHVDK
jgi:hypothetical protein